MNFSGRQHKPETRVRYAAVINLPWEISMTAIVYDFVQATSRVSDLAVIAAFSLAGVVLTLVSSHFGLDISAGILS